MRRPPSTGFCRAMKGLNAYVKAKPHHSWMKTMLDQYRLTGRLSPCQFVTVKTVLKRWGWAFPNDEE